MRCPNRDATERVERTVAWEWDGRSTDPVVWIDVARIDVAWRLEPGHHVGPGGEGEPSSRLKYRNVGERFLAGLPMWRPVLGIDDDTGAISFTDGRHRFAWLRDHGALAVPVETGECEAAIVDRGFGSKLRLTVFQALNEAGMCR